MLTFVAFRATHSLINCRAEGLADINFKLVTVINLLKKIFNNIPEKTRVNFTPWIFKETVVHVNFLGIKYKFVCAPQCDSNIFLNPYYHEYDVPLLVSTILKKGDIFIDVGAHCGLYTLLAGKIVGAEGQVFAIEPNPLNLRLLKRNIELNKLDNVVIIPRAASASSSKISIYYEKEKTAFTSSLKRASNKVEAKTIKVDDITNYADSVKILKIDTEGCDLTILKGAVKTLAKTSYVIVEQTDNDVQDLLAHYGFTLFILSSSRNMLGINRKANHNLVVSKILEVGTS